MVSDLHMIQEKGGERAEGRRASGKKPALIGPSTHRHWSPLTVTLFSRLNAPREK